MWYGRLDLISFGEHRVDVNLPCIRPIISAFHQALQKAGKPEKAGVYNMLQGNVIELSQSKWTTPLELAPGKEGILLSCNDYKKLNFITVRHVYLISRMDE